MQFSERKTYLADLISKFMEENSINSIKGLAEHLGLAWETAAGYAKGRAIPPGTKRKVMARLIECDPEEFENACLATQQQLEAK